MDVWQEFGIERLSPSQLSKASGDLGIWYASARAKVYEDAGPAAWRGEAVEGGLFAALSGRPAPEKTAREIFEARSLEWSKAHDGEVHPGADEEESKIGPALERAISAWEKEALGTPDAYQVRAEGFLPKTRVKMFGKPDFALKSPAPWCVDLKTSKQLPSVPKDTDKKPEPKTDHAIAASIYATLRGEERAGILYVSTADKPRDTHRLIVLEKSDIEFYVRAAVQTVKRLETILTAAVAMSEFEIVSPEEALAQLCRPNLLAEGGGTFALWKDDYAARALAAVEAWN